MAHGRSGLFAQSAEVKGSPATESSQIKERISSIIDSVGQTETLIRAVSEIKPERHAIALKALKSGANPNFKDSLYGPPLLWAAINNDIEMIKLLLDYQADINISGHWMGHPDTRALHVAVEKCNKDLVILLLQRGADPRLADGHGLTPSEAHVEKYDSYIIEILELSVVAFNEVEKSNKSAVVATPSLRLAR